MHDRGWRRRGAGGPSMSTQTPINTHFTHYRRVLCLRLYRDSNCARSKFTHNGVDYNVMGDGTTPTIIHTVV